MRSHIKLDSFGLELGRLGSIVISFPENKSDEHNKLMTTLRQAIAGFGINFNLFSLYPWLGNSKFVKLTQQRTQAIRKVTKALYCALKDMHQENDLFEILPSTTHKIFLIIQTHIKHQDYPSFQNMVLSRLIAQSCYEQQLPVLAAGTLGLNQITVNDFINLTNQNHQVRIASADIPLSLVFDIATHIRQTILSFSQDYHVSSNCC